MPEITFIRQIVSPVTRLFCARSADRNPSAVQHQPIGTAHYILVFLIGLFILLYYAPCYLTYADMPEKSDAVVLFVGPDSKKRYTEAQLLLTEGYADYQIIPAYRKIRMTSALPAPAAPHVQTPEKHQFLGKIKKYYENTHVEAVEAKRLMDQYGFKTAVFVSSPFHMRRIKIIAGKIFDDPSYRIVFVPARLETAYQDWLHLTKSDLNFIAREYIKILWYLTYSRFTS